MSSRKIPLRQPAKHNPPPRLNLQFPDGMQRVFTAYIGIQVHGGDREDKQKTLSMLNEPHNEIQNWLLDPSIAPVSVERFLVLDDNPNHNQPVQSQSSPVSTPSPHAPGLVWVCYWANEAKYNAGMKRLSLRELHRRSNPTLQPYIGLWSECFSSEVSRLETVYSATDYLPGLARLPGTFTAQHIHTGYWGAARDRIPGSGDDLFEAEPGEKNSESDREQVETLGACVVGTNPHNMVHIRSGQFWANCDAEERSHYVDFLEPRLRGGLDYLWQFPEESGSSAVRYLMNVSTPESLSSEQGTKLDSLVRTNQEACVTGFFKTMSHLEDWAARHRSHLVIHAGAVKHGKKFGDDRKFRTWHEVSVLKGGDARFEYVNCLPGTGTMRHTVFVERSSL